MKKAILLVIVLLIGLAGCSSTTEESWPKEIVGMNYKLTRNDVKYTGEINQSFVSTIYKPESEIVEESSLIVRVEIQEDPVEYKIDYIYMDNPATMIMLGFKAKVLKVFYTDENIKVGDEIKFVRMEYREVEYQSSTIRVTPQEMIHLGKGEYILFLNNNELDRKQDAKSDKLCNSAEAWSKIANYVCSGLYTNIIICRDESTYLFDQNFSTATNGAEETSMDSGTIMYEINDEQFDSNIQEMVDKYKNK